MQRSRKEHEIGSISKISPSHFEAADGTCLHLAEIKVLSLAPFWEWTAMTFRLVISKATRLKMWSCDLKVWFEKWMWGRIFVEVWHQLQTSFSRALARPSALGWKPRKVVIQSAHQVLWRSLPWFTLLWYSKSKLSGHLFGAQFWGSWFGGGIIAYPEARHALVSTHWNETSVWIPSQFVKWLLAVLVFWQHGQQCTDQQECTWKTKLRICVKSG